MPNLSKTKPLILPFMDEVKVSEFWERVEKSKGCWIWAGTFCGRYGKQTIRNHSSGMPNQEYAHRISYALHFGEPGSMFVLHECDNPKCVNPKHLFLGTQKANMQDAKSKGRIKITHHVGEKHGRAKITEGSVREIRSLCKNGASLSEVAGKFNLRKTHVLKIKNNQIWKCLT